MRRTPWPRLVAIAAAVAIPAAALLRVLEGRGWVLVAPPALGSLVTVGLSLVVGLLGWNVRQYVRGNRPGLDPLLAARTVVLATASAYTGALLTGWYAGHVLVLIGRLDHPPIRQIALAAALAMLGAVVLTVVGLVVERWCEVPPPEDDPGVSAGSAA